MPEARIVASPELTPACDFLTRSVTGPFIDTGVDVDDHLGRFVGRVYLSFDTVRWLHSLLPESRVSGERQEQDIEAAFSRGALEAVKENLGGDIVRVADALSRLLAHLPGPVPGGVAPEDAPTGG
jgi:hypothetical protein